MIRLIGSIVVAILMMAVPILATLSFVRNWDDLAKFILSLSTAAEFIVLVCTIFSNAE